MKFVFKKREIILIMVFCCITLLGIGFSSWNDTTQLISSITTGEMNYGFESGVMEIIHMDGTEETVPANIDMGSGKNLKVIINNESDFLNKINLNDKIIIHYSLVSNSENNISLKNISKDLGNYDFALDRNSVVCTYNGATISSDAAISLIPDTVGTFQVNHVFDGKAGYFELIPINLPSVSSGTLNIAALPSEMVSAMNVEIPVSDVDMKGKKVARTEIIKVGDLNIAANYNVTIEMKYDQFNSN